jgi:hypothetical protein
MAKTNTSILKQLHAEQPMVRTNSVLVLRYAEADRNRRFQEGLAWGFPYALRIMYKDPTLEGFLIRNEDPIPSGKAGPLVCFEYQSKPGAGVQIRKLAR